MFCRSDEINGVSFYDLLPNHVGFNAVEIDCVDRNVNNIDKNWST